MLGFTGFGVAVHGLLLGWCMGVINVLLLIFEVIYKPLVFGIPELVLFTRLFFKDPESVLLQVLNKLGNHY